MKERRDRRAERRERRTGVQVRPELVGGVPVTAEDVAAEPLPTATPAGAPPDGRVTIPGGTVTSTDQRVPRLPCPQCATMIEISLYDLVSRDSFTCPRCGLSLEMNRGDSYDAMKHVHRFYNAMREAEGKSGKG